MSRITTALLIALLVVSTGAHLVGLGYVSGLLHKPWLVGALGMYGLVATVAMLILVWTNVRRPRGIDPDTALEPATDASLMDQISQLLDRAAQHPHRSVRIPEGLTHDE